MVSKLLTDFLAVLGNQKTAANAKKSIQLYIKWRGILIEDLAVSGIKEQAFFEKYLLDDTVKVKRKTKIIRISHIRKFLRFHGAKIPRYQKNKQIQEFKDDKVMQDFLTLSGSKPKTKKNCYYAINKYCVFRKLSPTALIEESEQVSSLDITLRIKEFYDSMDIKSKIDIAYKVARFYRLLTKHTDVLIDAIKIAKGNSKKTLNFNKKIVDKEVVRKLLDGADLRDSMIIMALFESGLCPIDLMTINYGQLKQYLHLENPDSIDDVAVILHKRQKNNVEFLACIGTQSLRLMSKWLKFIQSDPYNNKWGIEITDKSPIFTMKKVPFERLKPINFFFTVKNVSLRVGYDKDNYYNPANFRKSFNTRAKKVLRHYDKELFMGHSGGIERHYDNDDLDYFTDEYRKAWEQLFDLTHNNVKYSKLEDEQENQNVAIKVLTRKNDELEQQIKFVTEDVQEYHMFIDLVTKALDKKKGSEFEDEMSEIIHTIMQERG